jgi:hypothetical protein
MEPGLLGYEIYVFRSRTLNGGGSHAAVPEAQRQQGVAQSG